MKKLHILFAAGLLGVALTGCSNAPKKEQSMQKQAVQTESASAQSQAAPAGSVASEEALKQEMAAMREKRVHFDFDKSAIKPEYFSIIQAHAKFMADHPELKVTIAGYCDERGSDEYNLALGERRANAAYNALVAEGVSPSRIQTVSYGEAYPLDPAHNEEAWAKNRRATFIYGINSFVRPH